MAQRSSLLQIAHTLHSARMATYLGSAHNDVARALDLYRWNLQLGAAFQEVLAVTEITLRNAVDHALRNRVSHLEPLLTVNVSARHTDVLRVIAAVSPATRDWCAGMSRVKETNQRRPA